MTAESESVPCSETEPGIEWIARHPGPWFALIWAPVLLAAPIIDSVIGGQLLRMLFLVLLGATYAYAVASPFRHGLRHDWPSHLTFALLLALCIVYLVLWQVDREFVFPLLAIAAAITVRLRWALSTISSLAITAGLTAGLGQGSLNEGLFLGFSTLLAGVANFVVQYLVGVIGELTRTRQRLAQTAVAEERLRFSRDLHDLLGHTLSVIVVKAEAVRRLLASDPDAATEHARSIETIGRQALTEIREAVTGYRSVGLAEELERARAALVADDIQVEITGPSRELAATVDSLLGWVVREGTTNVLRHAEASRCTITVATDAGSASVEIVDDGPGAIGGGVRAAGAGDRAPGDGSGLRGLRERIEGAGGTLTAVADESGFRLTASVPEHEMVGNR